MLIHQIDVAVPQAEPHVDLGVGLQKLTQHWHHMQAAKGKGRGHHQVAAWCAVLTAGGALSFVHAVEDAAAGSQIAGAGVRQHQLARGAGDEFGVEVLLKLGDFAAHGGQGHAQFSARCREAAGVNHRQKNGHGMQAVQRLLPLP